MPSTVDIVVQQGEAQHEEIFVEHRGVDVVSVELSLKHVSFTEDGTPLIASRRCFLGADIVKNTITAAENAFGPVSVSPSSICHPAVMCLVRHSITG